MQKQNLVAALAIALCAAACGGDAPTTPTVPPPDVAGNYYGTWTLQVLRKSDGFQKSFYCSGSFTFRQAPTSTSSAALGGFAVADAPCAPESYDLTGSVVAGGAVEFTTSGPRPLEGPCPGGQNVHYQGQITSDGSSHYLSARGVTTVTCPQFGEHEFTYLVTGYR
jgi:hypothetical protein